MFWRLRRQQFSAQIQSPKDFALRQGGKRGDGRSIQKYVTDVRKNSQRRISVKDTGQSTKNLPGGTSAVVPPDPMPNSEVKRRSADGSVGSPHARVGNCQASN